MKAYEAWTKANLGQQIRRASRADRVFTKEIFEGYTLPDIFGIDFSADDWEVVEKEYTITLKDTELSGTVANKSIGEKTISEIIHERGLKRPLLFTKIILAWEA